MIGNAATMKDMPPESRPVERALEKGAASLSDAELLAVLLRSGSRGETVLGLAGRLLAMCADEGLPGLYHMSLEQLLEMRGIGPSKAALLLCVLELSSRISSGKTSGVIRLDQPEVIIERYMEKMRHLEQEHVVLLMLDSRHMLIAEETISVGTVSGALVNPREVFMAALRRRTVSVILLHNHPSGDPSPSSEDILLTRRIYACGSLLGIPLEDHIIIGDRRAVSFCREGILEECTAT